jgi:pimeloyl-ACP methyl ester carboxylesterase
MKKWFTLLGMASALSLAPAAQGYEVDEVGSFHIGGRQVTLSGLPVKEVQFVAGGLVSKVDPNGEVEAEQMYVQYVKLANPKAHYPMLMWHGGGLTGVTWETKPDGKPGWQQFFLTAGHSVYVSDAVERGRSSFARYPEIFKSEPVFRTKKEAWELFRLGAEGSYTSSTQKTAYPDTQFPVDAFDQFGKQGVARWVGTDPLIVAAYGHLLQKVCPCVLMAHSQGGPFSIQATLNAPDKIKALIVVEPSASSDYAKMDFGRIKDLPVLIVYGDHWKDSGRWVTTRATVDELAASMKAKGAKVDWLDLPAMGIKGNSHMLMMDRNSDQIAGLIQNWLAKNGLMK